MRCFDERVFPGRLFKARTESALREVGTLLLLFGAVDCLGVRAGVKPWKLSEPSCAGVADLSSKLRW